MPKRQGRPLRIFVALSGGVDSAVSAALLKRQGHEVVGVFMQPWHPDGLPCGWMADWDDVRAIGAALGIETRIWDFSELYEQKVAADLFRQYRRGKTPNPDVLCNRDLKFGAFLTRALREGADLIATGHYARLQRIRGSTYLVAARDRNKDQTYFLWTLTQKHLPRVLFPIGSMTKPQVRALARRMKLPVAGKKDSQGICFVGMLPMKGLLQRVIPAAPGPVLHVDGRTLGSHDGAAYYTVGQRHGLDLRDGGGPYFVVSTDVRNNRIIVGSRKDLEASSARVTRISWTAGAPAFPLRCTAQIRYRSPHVPAVLEAGGRLRFLAPVSAVAPGQSVVFRIRGRVIGGGFLACG